IVSVSSYFPMTRQLIDVSYGSRHRSALGLTEKCDAIVFIVSEKTGKISVAVRGVIKTLSSNSDRLQDQIIHYLTVKPG
ncbi:diadenylate cyclase, partial [Mycoplasmoides pneumoniae]